MAKTDFKKIKRELNVPWITESGEFDYSKYPIDHPVRDAFSIVEQTFVNACRILGSMAQENRTDAGIFLIGLIVYYKQDIERVEILLESLKYFKNTICSDFLFEEIINSGSIIEDKKYIDLIINVLSQFSQEMVKNRFVELSIDKKFNEELRNKFLTLY